MQQGLLRCKRIINHIFSGFCLPDQTAALSFWEGNDSTEQVIVLHRLTVASQAWKYECVSKSLSNSSDTHANTTELLTECYLCASRSPVVILIAVLTAFSAIFALYRRLFQPQCHRTAPQQNATSQKNQAKRNSIASSFLDCRCATGTRSAFHALSRTRSVALSQIVSFAVKNRWEESSSVRWRGESRDAGQRSGAEARGDVIHSGEHHHRETDLCLRQTKHCPRPHVHNHNF